ncbi:MAG: hypothetical protein ACPGNT_11465, partial [Rhodospirillales bacterium]
IIVVLGLNFGAPAGAQAAGLRDQDPYAGYYYPIPAQIEDVRSPAHPLPGVNRTRRIAFITHIVTDMMSKPFPPTVTLFAQGRDAEQLIIISNREGRLNTLYRVRALLALLTASARVSPIFRELNVEDRFTFIDLAKMLGFSRLTLSDGDRFAHQIRIE